MLSHPKKIRLPLSSLLALLFVVALLQGCDLLTGKPEPEGFSVERLQRITEHMDGRVAGGVMVGGQGMIARNGRIVYNETYGQSDREQGLPMKEDAIYRIYSMTKPITGVALMMLYEEGRFHLNDPVALYIPELADLKVALSTNSEEGTVADGTTNTGIDSGDESPGDESLMGKTREPLRQPTIRDLLRHTAGFTYGIFGDSEVDRLYREAKLFEAKDLEEFVAILGQLPLLYEPGSRWHYSISVDVQGRLVEVLSGMSFGEFLQQRIFGPLGMRDTSFILPAEKLDRLTQIYAPKDTRIGFDGVWQRSASRELEVADSRVTEGFLEGGAFESGGGGLLSTTDDYMRFCLMMLNGGQLDGVRLLSPKSVQLMTRNHTGSLPTSFGRPGVGFGLGFAVAMDTGEVGEVGSDGEYNWGGAAGTRFWIDPAENLVGIFMVQSIPHQTTLGAEFHTLTYQAITDSELD